MANRQYRLLVVRGDVEPQVIKGSSATWKEFLAAIVGFLKTDEEYRHENDGLFYVEMDGSGVFKTVGSFSGALVDELLERAGKGVDRG